MWDSKDLSPSAKINCNEAKLSFFFQFFNVASSIYDQKIAGKIINSISKNLKKILQICYNYYTKKQRKKESKSEIYSIIWQFGCIFMYTSMIS